MTSVPTVRGARAEPLRARGLTAQEEPKLQQIVRPGSISSVRYPRVATQLASANGNRVLLIAQLVAGRQDVAPYRGDKPGLADCGHGHDARLEGTQPCGRSVVAGLSVRTGCGQSDPHPPGGMPFGSPKRSRSPVAKASGQLPTVYVTTPRPPKYPGSG